MKCLIISPKNGVVRISRFRAENFEATRIASPPPGNESESANCAKFRDLNSRRNAPFCLSDSLRARLCSASTERFVQA